MALEKGNTEDAKLLIEAGADVNAKDNTERTPLHWAIKKGNTEAIKVLIEAGADVNDKDDAGWSPLHLASAKGNTEAIELLIQATVKNACRTTLKLIGNPYFLICR